MYMRVAVSTDRDILSAAPQILVTDWSMSEASQRQHPSGYSEGARDAIRAQMISYAKRHQIGVPTLLVRMAEATGRSQFQISQKTLQNFLAGTRRTNDGFVKICDDFVRQDPGFDKGGQLGYALGYFFGEEPGTGTGTVRAALIGQETGTGSTRPISADLPGIFKGMSPAADAPAAAGTEAADIPFVPYSTLTIEQSPHGSFVPVREDVFNWNRSASLRFDDFSAAPCLSRLCRDVRGDFVRSDEEYRHRDRAHLLARRRRTAPYGPGCGSALYAGPVGTWFGTRRGSCYLSPWTAGLVTAMALRRKREIAGTPSVYVAPFALLRAAYQGDIDRVRALLIQPQTAIPDPETGLSVLHVAVGTNNLPLTRFLVETARIPFEPDAQGRWPSVIAAECGVSEQLNDYIVEQESAFIGAQGGLFFGQGEADQTGLHEPGSFFPKRQD